MNVHGLVLGYLNNDNLKLEESSYTIDTSFSFFGNFDSPKHYSSDYPTGYIGQEIFSFFCDIKIDSKDEIKLNNISFLYIPKGAVNQNNKFCGNLGLSIMSYYYVTAEANFIKNLKELNYINKYDFSIYFKNDTEGFLIIGEEPHNYFPNIYKINNLQKVNVLSDGYDFLVWKTEFTQIYFYMNDTKQKIKESKQGIFAIEYNYIIGNKDYKNKIEEEFFNKYLENNICNYEKINKERIQILICNKTLFDIDSFPTLYFYHRIFNYTFEFTKDELFLEKNDKYIFLIFFGIFPDSYFTLGKLFFKKYLFTFNQDAKTIGFYNYIFYSNEVQGKINNNFDYNKIIGIIILLFACFVGFFLAKKLYEKTRKKRINEINEKYEYKSNDTDDINYYMKYKDDKPFFIEIPFKSSKSN